MANPTVTPLVEALHDGGFIVSLANGHRSFDQVTLTGAAKIGAGTVLGKVTTGNAAAAVALGTNIGNGTFGAIALNAVPTQAGTYGLAYTSATAFTVTAPDGGTSNGTNGVAFNAMGIGFTMTTGGTPMVAGDGFTITVTQVVGKPTAASAANAGNVGNSTSSAVTTTGYPPMLGAYKVEFDSATTFVVEDPTGVLIGHGATGSAFTGGGITFTITAGGTPFAAADMFTVTVAAGSGKFRPWDPGNADGSQIAAGVLYAAKDVTTADRAATIVARAAEVNATELVWPTGTSAVQIALGTAQLTAIGILAR